MTAMKPIRLRAAAVLLLALTPPVFAQEPADANAPDGSKPESGPSVETAELRREIEELKRQIKMLQDQVQTILGGGAPATPAAPPAPVATNAAPTRSQNLLNPAISAVFQ